MAVTDWSTTAASNTMLGTIPLGEGVTTIAMTNNIARELMAQIASWAAGQPSTDTLVTKAAGVFSGTQPRYDGRGAYLHWNDASLLSGRCYLQAAGGSTPAGMAPGDVILEY